MPPKDPMQVIRQFLSPCGGFTQRQFLAANLLCFGLTYLSVKFIPDVGGGKPGAATIYAISGVFLLS